MGERRRSRDDGIIVRRYRELIDGGWIGEVRTCGGSSISRQVIFHGRWKIGDRPMTGDGGNLGTLFVKTVANHLSRHRYYFSCLFRPRDDLASVSVITVVIKSWLVSIVSGFFFLFNDLLALFWVNYFINSVFCFLFCAYSNIYTIVYVQIVYKLSCS